MDIEEQPLLERPIKRRLVLGGAAALAAGAALVVGANPALADSSEGDDDGRGNKHDEDQIRQLSINYGIGTDAISAKNKPAALALYARTFTADAVIAAGFDPAAPALVANGPAAWADIVENAFKPYTATQHLLGTINITFGRRHTARMTTYLHASHVVAAPSTDLLIVLGTYVDDVERRQEGWRIVHRFLQFTAFSTIPRSAP